MKSYTYLKTTILGELLLVANPTQLIGVYFSNCEHAQKPPGDWEFNPKHPVLRQAAQEIEEYLKGKLTSFSIPFSYDGTDFQNEIWRQIALIPFGETISYTELARRAGVPKALRAAGTATGRNPLGIIIPCHRVVTKGGGMGGYAGGLDRKRNLLNVESSQVR